MIYEYKCKACAKQFEVIKKLAEIDRVEECVECKCTDTERVMHAPGFTNSDSLGRRKAPTEFREWMGALHRNTPGSNVAATTEIL